jgi:L-amino acid N-acyltransferase YncA
VDAILRHADPARDAAACLAIYAPYVSDAATSFEDVPPSEPEFAERIERTARAYPWIVLEHDGRVAGFAYATEHRSRTAYRWAADCAIYVDPETQGRGAGRRLYEALLDLLRRQGLHVALAGITVPNDASVGLHRAVGFELVGTYAAIGWKAGAWRDVAWFACRLTAAPSAGEGPPPEPGPPQRLPR